jgi:hypothetical protein
MTDDRLRLSATAPGSPNGLPPLDSLDEARERAVRLLTDGFAYDVIGVDEFEWRLGQLSGAATARAIDALVADLAVPPAALAAPLRDAAGPILTEGRIVGIMSETRRRGPWRVPQLLRVKAVMSEVKIDLRYAVIPPACTIEVSAVMANVSFIVPPGFGVDFDVRAVMASIRNDTDGARDGYMLPNVRIRGTAVMAEVRVRVRPLGR